MQNNIVGQLAEQEADHVDLRLMLKHLLDFKTQILIIAALIFSAVMLYSMFRPVKYQSSILLKIQHKQHNVLGTITNPSQQLGLPNLAEEPSAVQIALIKSEFILRPVIKSLALDVSLTPKKSFFEKYFTKNHNQIKISELELPSKYLNQPLPFVIDINNHFNLYNKHGSVLLQGNEGRSTSPNGAIAININQLNDRTNNQFILTKSSEFETINKLNKNLMITDLSGSAENAANQVAILRVALIGEDPKKITKILNEIGIVTQKQNMLLRAKEADTTLGFLNQQLPIVKSALKDAEAKLNKYRSVYGKIDSKSQSEALLKHLEAINIQLEKNSLRKTNLLQQYTANHPFVRSINEEFNELTRDKQNLTKQLSNLPISQQQVVNLKREVEVKNNLYMLLLNQIHQLEVIKTGIVSDIEIISYASTPNKLQGVKLPIIGMISLIIGLIIGCIVALGWRILGFH